MATYREIVKAAHKRLSGHEVGLLAHVADYWSSLQWIEHEDQLLQADAELSRTGEAFVNLYPSLRQNKDPERVVLTEFGLFLLERGGKRAKALWENKLAKPDRKHIETVATRLADPQVRKTTGTYEAFVQALPDKGHAVERLIAIHLCNALKHHNIAFPSSQGVDIFKWGPTSEFANGQKYFSLTPLLSAYAPRSLSGCFGCAFADLVMTNLSMIIESSVQYAAKGVMLNVLQRSV